MGLVAILVLGAAAVPVGGALVQGCTLFFQPLVYVVVTRSTRLQGLSPLVAFGVGQALISAVVLAGNLVGKLLFQMAGETPLLLSAVCGGRCARAVLHGGGPSRAGGGRGERGERRRYGRNGSRNERRRSGLRLLLPDAALLVLRQENGSLRTAAPPRLQRCRMVIVPLASERREKIPPLFLRGQ